jgi:hypothetical protein
MPCWASAISCAGQRSSRAAQVPPTAERCHVRMHARHTRSLQAECPLPKQANVTTPCPLSLGVEDRSSIQARAAMFPWLSSRATGQPNVSATIGAVSALRSDLGHGAPRQPPPHAPARPPPGQGHGKGDSRVPQGGRLWDDQHFSAALVRNMSPVFLVCCAATACCLSSWLHSPCGLVVYPCRASSCCPWRL